MLLIILVFTNSQCYLVISPKKEVVHDLILKQLACFMRTKSNDYLSIKTKQQCLPLTSLHYNY